MQLPRQDARLAIEVVLRLPDGVQREVGVSMRAEAPASELAAALARYCALEALAPVRVARTGRRLDATPVTELGLARGDVLELGPPVTTSRFEGPGPEAPHLDLVAVGGPSMGSRWPLATGRHVVGRGRGCDIVVDDPALSRRHLVVDVEDATVAVTDAGSTNGTFIDGVPVDPGHRLAPGEVIEAGATLLGIEPHPEIRLRDAADAGGCVRFNRPPKIRPPASRPAHEVPAPPEESQHPGLPVTAALVPLVLALVLWRSFNNPSLLLIMALAPVMAVFSYLEDRRRGRSRTGRQLRDYEDAVTALMGTLEKQRTDAAEALRALYPSAVELTRRAVAMTPELWERRLGDDDFLALRVGWGDRPWQVDLRWEPVRSQQARAETERRLEPLLTLPSVPVTCSPRSAGVVGLYGDRPAVEAAARWWVVQAATLHSPEELSIAVLVPQVEQESWAWVAWLPHAARLSPRAPAQSQLETLMALLEQAPPACSSRETVVFVDEEADLPRPLLARLVREGPAAGISVVWLASARERLPGECGAIVEVGSHEGEVAVAFTDGGDVQRGALEGLDEEACWRIGLALAPIRDAGAAETEDSLPATVTLFDVLETRGPDAAWITDRWNRSAGTLTAPIGHSRNHVTRLDLLRDGPHMLIGGTTGAGKSELLQTIVASFAAGHPPERLNLLLIDYKGGAAFKDCVRLPHTVGFVTDLDPYLAERALISLDAELKRRERVLQAAGVRDLAELEAGRTEGAPARLILVVDEFATLVRELPSFVDGVVDLAQRGRSLGIHLVLATQRPAGVINAAIRANTDLRLALRVADEPDSDDVVGIPAAAHIPRTVPGRGYLRKGHGEVHEVQTAYAGASLPANQDPQVWDLWRRDSVPGGSGGPTQLEHLIEVIDAAARDRAAPPPAKPWLPPLPGLVGLECVHLERSPGPGQAVVGMLDRPALQVQEAAVLDLEQDGGAVVYGGPGAGKTTMLVTIAASLATGATTGELHLYGVDFGGGGLAPLRSLPHCGDVVVGDDPERVERLVLMLSKELQRRRSLFAERGVSSLGQLRRLTGMSLPLVVVLIDGYGAFTAAYEGHDMGRLVDLMASLVADGRAAGIYFVVTAERRLSIPSGVAAALPMKVVLRMSDPDDLAALGVDARGLRPQPHGAGRGFIDHAELQGAVVGGDPAPEAQAGALQALGERIAAASPDPSPPRVELLSRNIPLAALPPPGHRLSASVGFAEANLAPAHVDLTPGHFLVAGPYRSGRSTALHTIASSLGRHPAPVEMELLAPRRTPLTELDLWSRVAQGAEACEEVIAGLAERLARDGHSSVVIFVDDADELAEGLASLALEPIVRKSRDTGFRFVVAAETRSLHRSFGGWLHEIRKERRALLLDPDIDLDGDLVGVKLPRKQQRSFPPGRGYLVERGEIELVQVAQP